MVSDVAAETSVAQIPCIVINYRGLAGHWVSPRISTGARVPTSDNFSASRMTPSWLRIANI